MIWLEEDNQNVVIKSYPLVLVSVVVSIALVALVVGMVTGQSFALKDAAIFYGIIIGFLMIHRVKLSTFNVSSKKATFSQRNLFVNSVETLRFDEIQEAEIHYGRGGQYAKGGALVLISTGKCFKITDSDLHKGHQKNLPEALIKVRAALGAE
jgi:hypothetical protein|tara:strand:- start:143 stop:601 length:459 start_codon:yes stop_codon:yes gene_type:complete